jgi:hypothetical protein
MAFLRLQAVQVLAEVGTRQDAGFIGTLPRQPEGEHPLFDEACREAVKRLKEGEPERSVMRGPPSGVFLRTKHPAWSRWLDERVNVRLDAVPASDLFSGVEPFENGGFAVKGQDMSGRKVTLDAEGITRRETLRRISDSCKLRMTWDDAEEPHAIRVTAK